MDDTLVNGNSSIGQNGHSILGDASRTGQFRDFASLDQTALRRTRQVFQYLDELNQRRNPVKRVVGEQLWSAWIAELPSHSSINPGTYDDEAGCLVDGIVLKVSRAVKLDPPNPPQSVIDWLTPGWEQPDWSPAIVPLREVIVDEADGEEAFADATDRIEDFEIWKGRWTAWAIAERPARASLKLFETLYGLYGLMQRDGERQEFVLGDGILSWQRPDGGVHHPVLLQRLQLEFDPEKPEFSLLESDSPVELYTALFRGMGDIDGAAIGTCRAELEVGGYHPLGGEATNGYLRRLATTLAADGVFDETRPEAGHAKSPHIFRHPVIFLRTRTLGFATAIEGILSRLQDSPPIPKSLCAIVGVEPITTDALRVGEGAVLEPPAFIQPDDVLLSKPANPEQIEIARRLDAHGCVLVQGPPGTGKTHTIANLIGHLLANGKSVLVTSQKANALKVVREQVVPRLQPLCVSVTGTDADSRGQLETAVETIVERLSSSDAAHLDVEAEALASQRHELLTELSRLRERLARASFDEYRDVLIGGKSLRPSDAARYVADRRNEASWIPRPISKTQFPLTVAEVAEMYAISAEVSVDDERELVRGIPALSDLPTPSEFAAETKSYLELRNGVDQSHDGLWRDPKVELSPELLERIAQGCHRAIEFVKSEGEWLKAAIEAGRKAGAHREVWDNTLAQIAMCYESGVRAEEVLVRTGPRLVDDMPVEEQLRIATDIVEYLSGGKSLGWFVRVLHRDWTGLVEQWRVGLRSPASVSDFQAIKTLATLEVQRLELCDRWERLMTPLGGPTRTVLGEKPEVTAHRYQAHITRALAWYGTEWKAVSSQLSSVAFDWNALWNPPLTVSKPYADLDYLCSLVEESVVPALRHKAADLICRRTEQRLARLAELLADSPSEYRSTTAEELHTAVLTLSHNLYGEAHQRLKELHAKQARHLRRQELLARLSGAAPAWADAMRRRIEPHGGPQPPGDPEEAWIWALLDDELTARSSVSLPALQQAIVEHEEQLRRVTGDLIDRLAWSKQVKRTSLSRRQALMGWRDTIRRIGRGTGIRAPKLQAEARKLMAQSKDSVPVWIMPLSRVVESFDTRTTHFDVVIIDEASQCDVMGLIACFIADQVVVVGDHEQVSPDAVGEQLTEVEQLIAQYLHAIPNSHLYDGKQSIYDLAMQSFGGTICLREHFRCVPDIIQFSNWLSYEGRIKPLRDHSKVATRPFVVPVRVDGIASGKSNLAEAEAITSLLMACLELPEYEPAGSPTSFGIVSLVGSEQAGLIDSMLRSRLTPAVIERHRILCGSPSEFQGDERDIVFLSVVDTAFGGPLPIRQTDQFKKRFNVAASRARNQLWVVHSLNPETDLKPGDLRRRLIEHANDPNAFARAADTNEARTESEFERLVLRYLSSRGYHVTPQWTVGGYRIDMVVEDGDNRLAVECDGDRYHYTVEHISNDMLRQAILERLGWTFVRIRGSDFFRDQDAAMLPVMTVLERMGIEPKYADAVAVGGDAPDPEQAAHAAIQRAAEIREGWLTGEAIAYEEDAEARDEREVSLYSTGGTQSSPRLVQAGPLATPYVEYRMPSCGQQSDFYRLADAGSPELTRYLAEIVAAEGPIHKDEATRRLVSGWDMKKAGAALVMSVETVARRAQFDGRIIIRGEFLWPVAMDRDLVRGPSESGTYRPAHEIAVEEIAEACRRIVAQIRECDRQSLIVNVARVFGYRSTKHTIRARIEEGVQMSVDQGFIKTDGDLVVFPSGPAD